MLSSACYVRYTFERTPPPTLMALGRTLRDRLRDGEVNWTTLEEFVSGETWLMNRVRNKAAACGDC